jgi:hypothetical protein
LNFEFDLLPTLNFKVRSFANSEFCWAREKANLRHNFCLHAASIKMVSSQGSPCTIKHNEHACPPAPKKGPAPVRRRSVKRKLFSDEWPSEKQVRRNIFSPEIPSIEEGS